MTEYAMGANGNATPTTTISGSNTGLDGDQGVAVDASGDLFVANPDNNSITEYAPGASGNATPVATIAGSNTKLDGIESVVVDSSGDVFVPNFGNNSVTEYAPGANGNVTPAATISGSNTGLNDPEGVALDSSGDLFVANDTGRSVTEYAPGASGDATPIATISGSNTGLKGPDQMAVAQAPAGNEADLAAALTCPAHLTVGGHGTCTLKVTNHGPDAAAQVTASISLLTRLAVMSCSTGCHRNGTVVTWTRTSLADGSMAKFTVTVKAVTAGKGQVTAQTSSATTDPNPGNNHATAVITIKA